MGRPARRRVGILCFAMIFCLGCTGANDTTVKAKTASGTSDTDQQHYLKKLLSAIDPEDSSSLYHSQQFLMLPTLGAFRLNMRESMDAIVRELERVLDKPVSLGSLREAHGKGKLKLEGFLLDSRRSGDDTRLIFPVKSEKGQITDARLSVLQFSYLLSFTLKNICRYSTVDTRHSWARYVEKALDFLLNHIVAAYWLHVEAWHWVRPYRNMRERTTAKLESQNHPELQDQSYYRAFIDEDFFLFAIAADLLYVVENLPWQSEKPAVVTRSVETLKEIRAAALRVISQRTDLTKGFSFQEGAWDNSPTYAHAGYEGEEYPSSPCPKKNAAPDTSHFHRFPWWWRSFMDSWPKASAEHKYYESLLKNFSEHFMSKIVHLKGDNAVLLRNFIDGSNGWYRVGYSHEHEKFGYAPYDLSIVAVLGSYCTLAEFNDDVKRFNRSLHLLLSTDNKLRRKYYDEKYPTTFTKFLRNAGLYSERWSLYRYYCSIVERIGWK